MPPRDFPNELSLDLGKGEFGNAKTHRKGGGRIEGDANLHRVLQ